MVTQQRLKRALRYNRLTGVFTWVAPTGRRAKVGQVAGTVMTNGYRSISIDGHKYLAHRLAWLYVHGTLPCGDLDHRNMVVDDNRISNLRPATRSQNMRNCGKRSPKTATSKYKGVYWDAAHQKWAAKISLAYKAKFLGRFENERKAHFAYVRAALNLHGEFARAA